MKYYIRAQRNGSENQVDLSTATSIHILKKDYAEVKVGTTTYTIDGTEMVNYLISCCRNLELDQMLDPLKNKISNGIDAIGTKLDAIDTKLAKLDTLTEIKTAISSEADTTRTNDTDNIKLLSECIGKSIGDCVVQVEGVAGAVQNASESISFTLPNGTSHDIMLSNIADIWTCPDESYLITTAGDQISIPTDIVNEIKNLLNKRTNDNN